MTIDEQWSTNEQPMSDDSDGGRDDRGGTVTERGPGPGPSGPRGSGGPGGPELDGPQAARIRRDVLGWGQDRPEFEASLAEELRVHLDESLAPIVERLAPADTLAISKRDLGMVFSCERRFAADPPFVVSLANVRGTVFHRALERTINSPERMPPLERARTALEYCASSPDLRWCQEFLGALSPDDHHDLVRDVGGLVSTFMSDWPVLSTRWDPKVEYRLRARLAGGRVTLNGKPDLVVGTAQGTVARALIVDFKTGWVRAEHREDLRFYALLETLVRGVPPFRLVSYYPESGEPVVEDVTVALLESAARRVVDGIDRIETLRARRRPAREVGNGLCRFCAELPKCVTGTAHVTHAAAGTDDPLGTSDDLDDLDGLDG